MLAPAIILGSLLLVSVPPCLSPAVHYDNSDTAQLQPSYHYEDSTQYPRHAGIVAALPVCRSSSPQQQPTCHHHGQLFQTLFSMTELCLCPYFGFIVFSIRAQRRSSSVGVLVSRTGSASSYKISLVLVAYFPDTSSSHTASTTIRSRARQFVAVASST